MSPEDKNAVICSGGGAIGGAVARAFARKGARVFLAGCALTIREAAAKETRPVGGVARREDVVLGGTGVAWYGERRRRGTNRTDPDRPGARRECRLAVGEERCERGGLLHWIAYP